MANFQFDDLDKVITNVSNCVFGELETKRTTQDLLCKAVILSCRAYNSDMNFKNKIDKLSEFYNVN